MYGEDERDVTPVVSLVTTPPEKSSFLDEAPRADIRNRSDLPFVSQITCREPALRLQAGLARLDALRC